MQGIKASACDVQRAMRKEQLVAALVGSGADFGRMMLDSESRLWDALDLERVVFTDERVGGNRRPGNFHYQEMKFCQSYVLEIKEDSSPWSYSSRSLVGSWGVVCWALPSQTKARMRHRRHWPGPFSSIAAWHRTCEENVGMPAVEAKEFIVICCVLLPSAPCGRAFDVFDSTEPRMHVEVRIGYEFISAWPLWQADIV